MPKQIGKNGKVRRELEGKACPSCGWMKYKLVLRCDAAAGKVVLLAKCSRCRKQRDVEEDSLKIMSM